MLSDHYWLTWNSALICKGLKTKVFSKKLFTLRFGTVWPESFRKILIILFLFWRYKIGLSKLNTLILLHFFDFTIFFHSWFLNKISNKNSFRTIILFWINKFEKFILGWKQFSNKTLIFSKNNIYLEHCIWLTINMV